MNTLWAFGDSFTAGMGVTKDKYQYESYVGKEDLIWSKRLADYLGQKHKNFGVHGISNDMIWDNTVDKFNDIKKGDTVVIGLTKCARFSCYQPGHWQAGLFGKTPIRDSQKLPNAEFASTGLANIREYVINVMERNDVNFGFLCQQFEAKGVKAYFWNELMWPKFTRINQESSHNDHHWGVKGHDQMFNYLKKEMKL